MYNVQRVELVLCLDATPPPWDIQVYVPSEQEDKLWLNPYKIKETTEIVDI